MDSHATGLLSTLVISLVAAFAGGMAVRVIRLPPILGYLLAGILLGPATPGFIANQAIAAELAEVGVALLLFNIGLHFSLKDLESVRKVVVLGTLVQMAFSCAIGFVFGRYVFGCSPAAALIIGLSFSTASTAICSRLLDEKRQLSTLAGRIAVGWQVVSDIVVIFAMVMLPTLFNKQDMEVGELFSSLGQTILQVTGFGVVMFFGVRRYIPRLLGYAARIGSRELFTLAVIVIALGIAFGSALLFGVSIALGAFFAGVVIGESDLNHHAAAEALSMQQIFTILFFVSVGMLFDPSSLTRMSWEILLGLMAVVLGLGIVTSVVLILMHIPVQAAVIVGGIFSQIGELSFVLGQMGGHWGVLSQNEKDLILSVAIFSIVLNPLVFRLFVLVGRWAAGTQVLQEWQKYGEVSLPETTHAFDKHIILVGHGHVGKRVAEALKKNNLSYIVIESDRRLMERLNKAGTPVIYGDASREVVLSAAQPERAKLLILTIPNGTSMRQIAMMAKRINPSLEVVVRAHEETEIRQMSRLGINLAVMGEREIALGLSGYALQSYGIKPDVVLETMNALRS